MILVTGATGNVGSSLVLQLCRAGAATRALVRSPERADDLRGYDCSIAVGDYRDPGSLDNALEGIDSLFLLAPADPDLVPNETAVLDAIARTGRHIPVVKLAALGFAAGGHPIADQHREMVERLRASSLPHTVLAPNGFFQTFLRSAAIVQEQGILPAPMGDAAVSYVDARDVAAVAAHVLTQVSEHTGAVYEITGPVPLTHAQIAAEIGTRVDRPVRYVDVAEAEWRSRMLAAGWPEWQVEALLGLYGFYRSGEGARVTDDVEKATGRAARSLAEFLDDHPAAFKQR